MTNIRSLPLRKPLALLLLGGMALSAVRPAAAAADYAEFQRDLAGPYGHYRQALALTSNKDNADKAAKATEQFAAGWEKLAARYANDVPVPLAGVTDFSTRLQRPLAIGKEAKSLIASGQVAQAHAVLEEVRYLLWEMRIRAGINSVADKANDFHEAMEIVLDHAAAAKNGDELKAVEKRYGAWLSIKWQEQALAADLGPIRKDFDAAQADGGKAVAAYLDALRSGNVDAAGKLAGGVKNAYKRVWALDPR